MKNKKSILIILIVLLILILVELFPNIHLYKSSFNYKTESKWNNRKSIARIVDSNEVLPNFSHTIVVKYDTILVGDVGSYSAIYIDISDTNFSSLRIPFFKKSKYQISKIVKNTQVFKTDSTTCTFIIDGKTCTSGTYTIIGLCSYREAKRLVLEKVMNNIYKNVKEKIKLN